MIHIRKIDTFSTTKALEITGAVASILLGVGYENALEAMLFGIIDAKRQWVKEPELKRNLADFA